MATYKDMLLDIIQPTTERQYGGGLDDAYMNRRSAFADPNANSAFASPMSQGGLPTIYREAGGGADYRDDQGSAEEAYNQMAIEEESAAYGFDDFDQADADAGAAGNATPAGMKPEDTYISYDSRGRAIQSNSPADVALDVLNQQAAFRGGKQGYRDRFDELGPINPDSKLTNLQLAQRGIDRDLYNKAGIPTANFLENRGLATFGKGMRGMFEAYTPGDALYRDKDKDSIAAGRGVYDPGILTGSEGSPASSELGLRMRYAKEGETVADITAQMEKETDLSPEAISQAALDFGYSINSTAQASQVYESLNDARGSGMLQGLGLIAGGILSPPSVFNSLMSSYNDEGENTTPVDTAMGQVLDATGVSGLANRFGIDKDNKVLSGIGTAYDIAQRGPGALVDIYEPSRRGVSNNNEDMTDVINPAVNQDLINSYRGARERIDKDKIDALDNAYARIINKPSKEMGEMEYQSGKTTSNNKTKSTSKSIDTPMMKEVISEEKEEAPKQEPTSFKNTVLNFFKSTGSPAIPDQDDLGAGNDRSLRQRQGQPKLNQQQVASIVREATSIPEKVQATVTNSGRLPQYLALLRAGYTAEEAIKAIGLSVGTTLT